MYSSSGLIVYQCFFLIKRI